jgi:hypothetical protein
MRVKWHLGRHTLVSAVRIQVVLRTGGSSDRSESEWLPCSSIFSFLQFILFSFLHSRIADSISELVAICHWFLTASQRQSTPPAGIHLPTSGIIVQTRMFSKNGRQEILLSDRIIWTTIVVRRATDFYWHFRRENNIKIKAAIANRVRLLLFFYYWS